MAEYVRIDNLEVSDYVTVWDCNCSEYGKQTVMAVDDLQYLPTADVVEVVRCKDCVHWGGVTYGFVCRKFSGIEIKICMGEDRYCSYGERKE